MTQKMIIQAIAILILSFLLTPAWLGAQSSGEQWQPTGVTGGSGIFYIGINPYHTEEILLFSDMGLVFKTDNFGADWSVVHFQQMTSFSKGSVHYTDEEQVMYSLQLDFASSNSVLKKSIDGGTHWNIQLTAPTVGRIYHLEVNPHRSDELIVADDQFLYLSVDGGESFSTIVAQDKMHLAGAVWDGESIYLATNEGFWVSHNGGATFEFVQAPGLEPAWGFVSFDGARAGDQLYLYAVAKKKEEIKPGITGLNYVGEQKVHRFGKSGAEALVALGAPIEGLGFPFHIQTSNAEPSTVYVAGATALHRPMVMKSVDAGATWNTIFDTACSGNIEQGWAGCGGAIETEWFWMETVLGFRVSDVDPNKIVIGDYSFVHATTDGGQCWKALYVKPDELNDKGSAIPYGLFYQTNGLENTSVWHLSFVSDSVFFAAYTDLTGAVTKDAGQSWRVNLPGNDYNTTYHTLIHPLTGVLYAAVSTKHDIYQTTTVDDQLDDASGAILKSVDGGISWEMVYNFDQPVIWLAIDPTDPAVMYASVIHSENGGIYKTHNIGEGTQWTRLNQPEETEGHPYVVEVLNDGTVVASFSAREFPENQFTPSSGVFMSSDGGQSWEKRAHPEMDFWTKDLIINPHDSSESEWLAATFRGWGNISPTYGGLYRTRDRGFTWKEIGHFSQWVESAIYHPDDPDILLVCTEHDGLWITYNASEETPDFQLIEDYPFAHPTRVFFNPYHPTTDIWVTSFGNGIRRSTEGVSPVTEFPSSRRTILIYPNPTTDWLHVDVGRTEVGMSERAVFTLYLFNRLGQQVGTWRLNAVHNRIAVDQLESGIYFYRIDHPTVHLGSGKISIY